MKCTTRHEHISSDALALAHRPAPAPVGKDDTHFKGI